MEDYMTSLPDEYEFVDLNRNPDVPALQGGRSGYKRPANPGFMSDIGNQLSEVPTMDFAAYDFGDPIQSGLAFAKNAAVPIVNAASYAANLPAIGFSALTGHEANSLEQSNQDLAALLPIGKVGAIPKNIADILAHRGLGSASASNTPKSQVGAIGYHGSPYRFTKFDTSKIGTGEGAQAFGHGLYFAENPSVAKGYAEQTAALRLSNAYKFYDKSGKVVVPKKNNEDAFKILSTHQGNYSEAKKTITSHINDMIQSDNPKWWGKNIKKQQKILSDIENMESNGIIAKGDKGNIYQVDIPDEHVEVMLDWDKPLSQQHPTVQKAFENFKKTKEYRLADDSMAGDLSAKRFRYQDPLGKDIHGAIFEGQPGMGMDAQKAVADYLYSNGIRGIKYLDHGSRGVGEGTRNFVVFNPEDAKITHINDKPIIESLPEDQLLQKYDFLD
jgi:hypothetical protein